MKLKKENLISSLLLAGQQAYDNKNYEAANKIFNEAIAINRRDPRALLGLANSLRAQALNDDARLYVKRAMLFGSDYPEVQIECGINFLQIGDYFEAIACFDKALALILKSKDKAGIREIKRIALFNKAVALKASGNNEASIIIYKTIIEQLGGDYSVHFNMANTLTSEGLFDEAIQSYLNALKYGVNKTDIMQNLAIAYLHAGLHQKAKDTFEQILSETPNSKSAEFGLANIALGFRQFDLGWDLYKARWHDPTFLQTEKNISSNYLTLFTRIKSANELKNKSILILGEQGPGDTIMFLSILPDLLNISENITVLVNQRLMTLLKNSFSMVNFYDIAQPHYAGKYDVIIPVGDLPAIFRKSAENFNGGNYLLPLCRNQSASDNGRKSNKSLRVGISWRGGVIKTRMYHRSLMLNKFIQIFDSLDCELISLQHGDVKEEIQEFNSKTEKKITEIDQDTIHDFNSLACLISELDFVVSVQNTNVHLSGALGKKCFVLLPHSPEWRYGYYESKMPWYSSVELFRQSEAGNWDYVIMEVKQRLKKYVIEQDGEKHGGNL